MSSRYDVERYRVLTLLYTRLPGSLVFNRNKSHLIYRANNLRDYMDSRVGWGKVSAMTCLLIHEALRKDIANVEIREYVWLLACPRIARESPSTPNDELGVNTEARWPTVNTEVRRLLERIFTAETSQSAGDTSKSEQVTSEHTLVYGRVLWNHDPCLV